MDSETIQTPGSARLKRDLGLEAVNLALQGEWQRATEVNKAILELFPGEVEAMNRLVKALIELGSYLDARAVLDRVIEIAPYNKIAKKNLARLDQLSANPGSAKQPKKSAGAPQIFIEESGKSATTLLRQMSGKRSVVDVSPSDQVVLSPERTTVAVRTLDGQLLGQVEPKMGKRLARLIEGGNRYTAAVVTVGEEGVTVIIRETFKDRGLQNVCSFPSKLKDEDRVYLKEAVARFMQDDDLEEDDEEENVIDEDALDTGVTEDE
ncbi:MAG: tetratricopeptide repeat protein [Chloroflexi bacterium]|nr:tetratricopeptide repeat protein [Chloroflexota bacterium]MDA1271453.1 tetratricopeptide repeat protein [Chloroflexota bacterium]PKB58994.1 MAG: hypothetical protein BZY83_04390 [SAR202 cluster bacterium Casp-Chloro-G2]